jgi:polygalacturonase
VDGTNLAVRIKTMRGRGGGVEDVVYENLSGATTSAIQLTLNYGNAAPTNASATPEMRRITLRNLTIHSSNYLECDGLDDSIIEDVTFEHVTVTGGTKETCTHCEIKASDTSPTPKCTESLH